MSNGADCASTEAPALNVCIDRADSILGITNDCIGLMQQLESMLFGDQPRLGQEKSNEARAEPAGKVTQLDARLNAAQNQGQTVRDLIQQMINKL